MRTRAWVFLFALGFSIAAMIYRSLPYLTRLRNPVTLAPRAADTGAYVSDGHWESGSLFMMLPTREQLIHRLTGLPVEHGSDMRLSRTDSVRIANIVASLYPLPFFSVKDCDDSVVVAPSA